MPVTSEITTSKFLVRQDGKLHATPLFVALVIVDITDVVFAVDSIPAILAVTRDPFLVFTSNAFAILGLRSLYFAVAGLMAMFRYLKYSLVLILAFVGVKMLLVNHYHVPNLMSLAIIVATLGAGVLASLWATSRDGETETRLSGGRKRAAAGARIRSRADLAVRAVPGTRSSPRTPWVCPRGCCRSGDIRRRSACRRVRRPR